MIWPQVVMFIISLAISVYSYMNQPRPKDAEQVGLAEFDVPTCEEGKIWGRGYGRCQWSDANVVWYGNLRSVAIKSSGGKK